MIMNKIVKYENYMNNLRFNGFTAVDFNFLMALCSEMRDKGTTTLEFSFMDLKNITGYAPTSLKRFISDILRMNDKLMSMKCILEKDGEIFQFVLFPTFSINANKELLTVSVNEKFAFILNDLTKNFTRFELEQFIKVESKYAKNLYRLLKQYRRTGRYEVSLNDFRIKTDCPSSYTNKHVMDKIIKPSLKELREKQYFQNLQCTVKYEHKRGKPVSGYIFTFTPEQIPKPKELPEAAARPSEPQKGLTQEEKDKLVSEFGRETVKDYIQRTKTYKCCNYATIKQWILEDRNKKPKSSNQFNNFPQRDYSQEYMDSLEKMLINKF